jgi:hypothetical protein
MGGRGIAKTQKSVGGLRNLRGERLLPRRRVIRASLARRDFLLQVFEETGAVRGEVF